MPENGNARPKSKKIKYDGFVLTTQPFTNVSLVRLKEVSK
jgi:hypothetical protein